MQNPIVISLSQTEAMKLERIVLDGDKEEALRLIETVLIKKVREASRPHRRPAFELPGGGRKP